MYKVYFEDGTTFLGGEPAESLWNDMPDKLITKIEYEFLNIRLVLEGFKRYNHLVGRRNVLFTKLQNDIYYISLVAEDGQISKIFTWNLIKKEFIQEVKQNIEMKKSTGWKIGKALKNPTLKINP